MSDTHNLALPLLAAGQAQKHVTVNEALARLDALVHLAVLDRDRTEPPAGPEEGDRHIVADDATGTWTGRDGSVAAFQGGGWVWLQPREGWCAFVADENAVLFHDGASWQPLGNFIGGIGEVPSLGIGTAPDGVNTFAAKLNTALWTAKTAAEGGNGDLRYIMNKEGSGDVLSLLLQSGYEGRAELGLVGDDDLVVKVSADGDTWHEAIRIDRTSGEVDFPSGAAGIGSGGGESSGGTSGDLELTISLLALQMADMGGGAISLGACFADGFVTLTQVDVAGATNLDTGTSGRLKPTSLPAMSAVPAMTGNTTPSGTVSATSIYSGGLAAWYAFDGVAAGSNCWLSAAVPTGGAPQDIAYDFGTATAIASYTIRNASSSAAASYSERAPNSWTFDGWNGTSWVTLDTRSGQAGWGNAEQRAFTLAATATGYSKYRLRITAINGGSTGVAIGEIELKTPAMTGNVTVRSAALSAGFVPAALQATARLKVPAGYTLAGDVSIELSRDGGSTWLAADLAKVSETGDMIVVHGEPVDMSAMASGSTIRWRWKTLTNKAFELDGICVLARRQP